MRKLLTLTLMVGALATSGARSADFGLYGTAGTVGLGGGVAANFGQYIGARVGYTSYTYEANDLEQSDLSFSGEVELGGTQALLDLHPFGGGFRLSLGMMENAQITGRALPTANTFTFDGVTYSSADVGEARGSATFDSFSPYVGLGYGRALSRRGKLAMNADLGVALTGAADVQLDVSCATAAQALCTDLLDDVAAEQAQIQADAEDYKYWPVLSIGLSYRF